MACEGIERLQFVVVVYLLCCILVGSVFVWWTRQQLLEARRKCAEADRNFELSIARLDHAIRLTAGTPGIGPEGAHNGGDTIQ